jgi:phosphatidylethanolamine/phosphatidyl-N-methylethanolamine N-methyltransferase
MQPGELIKEGELFFRQWLRSPKSMGSVIPSSRALAKAVAQEVAWKPGQYVVELGGGTGAISQGLIDRGIPRSHLIVIELDTALHAYLRERLTDCLVIQGDATRLGEILGRQRIGEIGTVISGLPMVSMPFEFQRGIIEQGFKMMPPGSFMLQYSYSPVAPVPAAKLGIEARLARYVLRNFPPAAVWKYRKLTA